MSIVFDKLWSTLKQKGVSQYDLITKYNISASIIHRLKENDIVKTSTLDALCEILNCNLVDICDYKPNNSKEN